MATGGFGGIAMAIGEIAMESQYGSERKVPLNDLCSSVWLLEISNTSTQY